MQRLPMTESVGRKKVNSRTKMDTFLEKDFVDQLQLQQPLNLQKVVVRMRLAQGSLFYDGNTL